MSDDTSNGNGNGGTDIVRNLIMDQARRAEQAVRNADFSKCPVPGQQAVMVFLVSGMKVLLGKELAHSSRPKYQKLLLHPNAKLAYIASAIFAIKEIVLAVFSSKP